MQLSVLNDLKKVINYNNKSYSFVIYVTAWCKLCVAYSNQADPHGDRIFSTVVDPDTEHTNISMIPEEISTVQTMDDAIRHIRESVEVMECGQQDEFELPEYKELDLNLEEEENRPVYCEAPEGMIPIVTE